MPNISAPVSIAVNPTSASRFSALNPPYVLLNLSTSGTAWIADNPGIQVGQGQPIYPGASLTWNTRGDIWLIADETFTIVASQDVTDWQPNPVAIATAILNSGMILVDQPVELFNGSLDNAASSIFDITTYQSLCITISPTESITFPTCPRADLIFFKDDTGLFEVYRRVVMFADNAGNAGPFKAVLPAIGGGFRISMVGANSGSDIQIIASHRPLHLAQSTSMGNQGNHIWVEQNLSIGAGASANIQLPPYIGLVDIDVNTTGGNHANSIIFVAEASFGAQTNRRFAGFANPGTTAAGTAVWQATMGVPLTGGAVRLRIDNTDVASRAFNAFVSPHITQVGTA